MKTVKEKNQKLRPLRRVAESGQITIPIEIRKDFNINRGDYVEVIKHNNVAIIRPVKGRIKNQVNLLSAEWEKMEAEADEDIKKKRFKAFNSVEELINDLDN